MSTVFLSIGFGYFVAINRIVTITPSSSAPMKRLRDEAKKIGKLIDATEGKRTRSIIVTDSDHIILSSIKSDTLIQRHKEDKLC